MLKYKMCIKYQSNIEDRRIYGFQELTPFEPEIFGVIHILINMHTQRYCLERVRLRLEFFKDTSAYVPISKVLHHVSEGDKKTLKIEIDIAHFVAVQRLALTNYATLCQLEAKHGVDVGAAYVIIMLARHSVTSLRNEGDNSCLKI